MKSYFHLGSLIIVLYSMIAGFILWLTPVEKTLGHVIKYVFFHVSLTYASLYCFYLSAFLGLIHLIMAWMKKENLRFGEWSLVLGKIAIAVWGVSVVISIYAMQLAWGEITFNEPLTIFVLLIFAFAVGKELLIADKNIQVAAIANILLAVVIAVTRPNVGRIMHPDDPIGTSELSAFKIMSTSLILLTFIAMIAFAYWLLNRTTRGKAYGSY